MNLTNIISNIHWLPVTIMTLFSFVIGVVWHSSFLFGVVWKKENKYEDQKKINIPLIFGGTAVMHFIAMAGLSALISGQGSMNGLLLGLLVSIVWILPAMTGTYLFANRSVKLVAIDAGMYIVLFSFAGMVFGIW